MASQEFSFDVVSRADMMEVKNAILQAQKELGNRFDFRGSIASIEFDDKEVTLHAEDEFRMDQLKDIVVSKLLKRGIEMKQLEWGKPEPAAGVSIKVKLSFKNGIPQDKAKALVKDIKDNKALKVNAQIQGEEVRVSSKSKDDLQKAMTFIKGKDLDYVVAFVNLR